MSCLSAYGSTNLSGDAISPGFVATDVVDRFIAENQLDDSAARLLRSERPEVQAAVVGRGSLADCRNPSSAVMGRIRDAKMASDHRQDSVVASPPSTPRGILGGSLVDRFIADNRLDDTAARLLRCETPEIQSAVVERGSLVDCRNPSSAVMGRIRDAKLAVRNAPLSAQMHIASQGAMDSSEVDRFIVQNRLDTGAARSLKEESLDVQRAVMDRGSVADCTNPSAAIMGRINDAKLSRGGLSLSSLVGSLRGRATHQGSMAGYSVFNAGTSEASYPVASSDDMDLDQFILEGRIDSSAEKALRGESPEIQMAVMMKGGLENCVNPSSAVMGRINEARQQARSSGLLPAVPQPMEDGDTVSVDEFIVQNNLDDNAARALKQEPADVQEAVMERGSLVDCFNASAAVMGRIRDVKLRGTNNTGGHSYGKASSLPPPDPEQVEEFIIENDVDENAARALRTETLEVQAEVLERGSLADCINASAAVMGRIRDAKMRKEASRKPSHGGGGCYMFHASSAMGGSRIGNVTPDEVEQFIVDNRLDDSAARALMAVSPDIQAAVMERGSLAVTMNPSSAVMGRIRDAKLAVGSSRGGTGSGFYGALSGIGEVLRSSPY